MHYPTRPKAMMGDEKVILRPVSTHYTSIPKPVATYLRDSM